MERLLNALNANAIILVSIGVPLAYWLLVVLVRWHKIAVPTRRLDRLYQSIEAVVEKAGAKTAAQPAEKNLSTGGEIRGGEARTATGFT